MSERWPKARGERKPLSENAKQAIVVPIVTLSIAAVLFAFAYFVYLSSENSNLRQQQIAERCLERGGIWIKGGSGNGDMCIIGGGISE